MNRKKFTMKLLISSAAALFLLPLAVMGQSYMSPNAGLNDPLLVHASTSSLPNSAVVMSKNGGSGWIRLGDDGANSYWYAFRKDPDARNPGGFAEVAIKMAKRTVGGRYMSLSVISGAMDCGTERGNYPFQLESANLMAFTAESGLMPSQNVGAFSLEYGTVGADIAKRVCDSIWSNR